jgi:hypothetical protein
MTEELKIEDFIPAYPEQNDPYIQSLTTVKREFAELSALPTEPIPKRGEFYRHQKLFMRYLAQYDRCLNFRETGTGKSCDLIALAEFLKDNPGYKRAYILERGDATKDEFRNQIVCKCTPEGEYDVKGKTHKGVNDSVNKIYHLDTYTKFANKYGDKDKISDAEIDAKLSGCIFLIDEAHNLRNVKELKAAEEGKKIANGTQKNQGLNAKDLSLNATYTNLMRIFRVAKRTKIIISTATPMINDVSDVIPLINLLLPKEKELPTDFDYTRITLNEIEYYIRGMVTFVRGLDTGVDVNYRGLILNIENKFRVVDESKFITVPNTGLDSRKNRDTKEITVRSTTPIYVSRMIRGQLQQLKYMESISKPEFKNSGSKTPPFKIPQRQASCFAFPTPGPKGKYYGVDAGDVYINVVNGIISAKPTPIDFMAYLASPDFLANSGIKIATIMDIEAPLIDSSDDKEKIQYARIATDDSSLAKKSYDLDYTGIKYFDRRNVNGITIKDNKYPSGNTAELSSVPKPSSSVSMINIRRTFAQTRGNAFIYTEYVRGGGAYLIGLAFMARGYMQYKGESALQESIVSGNSNSSSYCVELGSAVVHEKFQKMPRFAIITSGTSVQEFRNILNLFNSRENINGEYLQVIIGSEVARDGINLSNVVRGHIFSPPWNRSGMHQATSRFIRATSHDYIIEYLKRLYNQENARVKVDIFLHAAIQDEHIDNSVDIHMYNVGEDKDFPIHHFFRLFKKCAFDCDINKARNIRDTDENGSAICDYELCKYTSFSDDVYGKNEQSSFTSRRETGTREGFPMSRRETGTREEFPSSGKRKLDTSTYDILYVDELLDNCANEIVEILKLRGGTNLDELYAKLLEKYGKKKYIHMALSKVISSRKVYINTFGYMCYIISDGFNVYFQREYPRYLGREKELLYPNYGNKIVSVDTLSFIDLIYQNINANYYDYFDKLIQNVINLGDPNLIQVSFAKIIDRIPLPIKIKMVENCLYKKAMIIARGEQVASLMDVSNSDQKLPTISNQFQLANPSQNVPKGLAFGQSQTPVLTQVDIMIINRMRAYYYEIPEPSKSLKRIQEILADRSRVKKLKPKEIDSIERGDIGSPIVYVHVLYNIIKDNTSYAMAAKTGRAGRVIRILHPNETLGWRNAERHEYIVYEHLVEQEFKKHREKYEVHDYYGSILLDGKFRVVEKSQTGETNYGRVCGTDSPAKIIEAYLNVCRSLKRPIQIPGGDNIVIPLTPARKPNMESIMESLNKEGISKYIVKTSLEKTEEENIAAYKLLQIATGNKLTICDILKETLEEGGRILAL